MDIYYIEYMFKYIPNIKFISQIYISIIAWLLVMDKQNEQGNEPEKKKKTINRRHRPRKQKNVSNMARGKLAYI